MARFVFCSFSEKPSERMMSMISRASSMVHDGSSAKPKSSMYMMRHRAEPAERARRGTQAEWQNAIDVLHAIQLKAEVLPVRRVDAHVMVGRREVRGDEPVAALQALGEVD
jgi:hypothetical protein